jgi:GDPmannose 4,6-dehydratase
MPRALITGVTGQDGWYLAELLNADGYDVYGLVSAHDAEPVPPGVTAVPGDMRDADTLRAALATAEPDELYNLAAVSSVAESWKRPELVADVNGVGVVRLLSAVRDSGAPIRFVQASSAEIFGDAPAPQDETTPIRPVSPYGAAKAFAHHAVVAFRGAGLWAANAILYNHESPRRPPQFVTRKITSAAARIGAGSPETLLLGNLDSRRDWGFAGDYMRALTLMARRPEPDDYVVATGVSRTVRDFVATAFAQAGVRDWERRVGHDPQFVRSVDAGEQRGDARKARRELGWEPLVDFPDLVKMMVAAEAVPGGAP